METRLAAKNNTQTGKRWVELSLYLYLLRRLNVRSSRPVYPVLSYILIFFLLTSSTSCTTDPVLSQQQPSVQITEKNGGYAILRNGEPFVIRGAAGHRHLPRLKRMGGNTIRVYDTNQLGQILDSAHAHGIAVIAGLWMMGDQEMDYTDSFMVAQQHQEIRASVQKYRHHPALLMWCLGNEISYRASIRELFFPDYMWLVFEDLVDMIHEEDPDHPVSTTITNFQRKRLLYFKFRVPQLDLVGINTFGRIKELKSMSRWYNWFFDVPYFLSEWAITGPWEATTTDWYTPIEASGTAKAEEYAEFYTEHIPHDDPRFLGSCVFYWGQKQEHTHSWFSLFTEEGRATPALQALEIAWTGKSPKNYIAVTDSLLLNGHSSEDGIVLSPGQPVSAQLFASDHEGDRLQTKWEILPDAWHFDYRAINEKPSVLQDLIEINGEKELRFTAPEEEGAYRLFAKVTDSGSGGSSIINTTFLVMR